MQNNELFSEEMGVSRTGLDVELNLAVHENSKPFVSSAYVCYQH